MGTTFINTRASTRIQMPGSGGEAAEILSRELGGAKNVVGTLHWLRSGNRLEVEPKSGMHQLVYLTEGAGVITLANKDYEVSRGAGAYLQPAEGLSIRQSGTAVLKLFHLEVPAPAS